jgi:hypothetical protein
MVKNFFSESAPKDISSTYKKDIIHVRLLKLFDSINREKLIDKNLS